MSKIFCLLLFLCGVVNQLPAQILPKEGNSLNYRIIGFSFPSVPKTNDHKLEIAKGYYVSEDSFRSNIIKTVSDRSNRVIAEVPSFGAQYTWRVVYNRKGNTTSSILHHFSTKMIPNVDTSFYRLRVLKTGETYKDAFVFLDDNKVLYDMNGRPVWFLPPIGGHTITPRDIKLSPQGTITFLFNPAYEVNYNGDVLWKGPQKGTVSGDYNENCHHEFTRLHNGHYMVLGTENVYWKQHSGIAGDYKTAPDADTLYKKTPFGTVIEYDEQGNVVWYWKSSKYFTSSDLVNFETPGSNAPIDVHENAFYFDEQNKHIYVSYKNINRVIKLKYPEGIVLNNYGEIYRPGIPEKGNGLFCGQHSCNISREGYLYLFNNNSCETGVPPKIIMMKEPTTKKDTLEKVWEYQCTIEGVNKQDMKNYRFISGGSVQELPDRSIFACMNGTYSKIFIVNREKEIMWSALAERWDTTNKRWEMTGQYRSYLIDNRKKLEELIWNSDK